MDARRLHTVESADGTGQVAFKGTEIIDVLHEAGRAESIRLVENLVADAAALGEAVTSERHAQTRDPIVRRHHDVAVVTQLERDPPCRSSSFTMAAE